MKYIILNSQTDVRAVLEAVAARQRAVSPERRLCCTGCGLYVTDTEARVQIEGSHDHHCRSPEGQLFQVGCYVRAEGLTLVGDATRTWTWFHGCRWRAALCARCGRQLGWEFSGYRHFWALIKGQLSPCATSDNPL